MHDYYANPPLQHYSIFSLCIISLRHSPCLVLGHLDIMQNAYYAVAQANGTEI